MVSPAFAILSSMNYRQTMQFAEKCHQLATPLTELRFKEQGGCGMWTITPMPHTRIDASLYKFLVETQFGICARFTATSWAHVRGARVSRDLQSARRCRDLSGYVWMPGVVRKTRKPARVDATWLDGTQSSETT